MFAHAPLLRQNLVDERALTECKQTCLLAKCKQACLATECKQTCCFFFIICSSARPDRTNPGNIKTWLTGWFLSFEECRHAVMRLSYFVLRSLTYMCTRVCVCERKSGREDGKYSMDDDKHGANTL
jgi:hypothetical protein